VENFVKFKSKPEAYLHSLHILSEIRDELESQEKVVATLDRAIEQIQIEIENHQQDLNVVTEILLSVSSQSSNNNDKQTLSKVIESIQQSNYEQTIQNELGRRIESQIQIELLLNPTDAMMASVKKMSEKIIEILDTIKVTQNCFLKKLFENAQPIAFGSYQEILSYKGPGEGVRIRDVLFENRKEDLTKIMHMHFKFSQFFSRKLKGKYEDYSAIAYFIADVSFYGSEYFKERGRKGKLEDDIKTKRMGVSLSEMNLYSKSLPMAPSSWTADAKAQKANLDSPFVKKLIKSDTPYVAGPSGMTGLFIGQYIGFNVHTSKEEQQLYLAAVTAYMVSGGFHSLHEVLAPVAHCLLDPKLIPGYQVSSVADDKENEPPNYHAFYALMIEIDPEFSNVRRSAWEKIQKFYKNEYLPWVGLFFKYYQPVVAELKKQFLTAIICYEEHENKKSPGTSGFFRNPFPVRLQKFPEILKKADSPLQILAVGFSLLIYCGKGNLRDMLIRELGFKNNVKDAVQHLNNILNSYVPFLLGIDTSCPSTFTQAYADEIGGKLKEFIKIVEHIAKLANDNNKSVENINEVDTFLLKIKEIDQQVQVQESPKPSQ
jgi:hypothetical protein